MAWKAPAATTAAAKDSKWRRHQHRVRNIQWSPMLLLVLLPAHRVAASFDGFGLRQPSISSLSLFIGNSFIRSSVTADAVAAAPAAWTVWWEKFSRTSEKEISSTKILFTPNTNPIVEYIADYAPSSLYTQFSPVLSGSGGLQNCALSHKTAVAPGSLIAGNNSRWVE